MPFLWKLPARKPSGLSETDYVAIMHRHDPGNPPCERFARGECGPTPCQTPDSDGRIPVEFGHRQARSLGGDMSAHNIQLECRCVNRAQGPVPDSRFEGPSPFDQEFDFTKLRTSQALIIAEIDENKELFTTRTEVQEKSVLTVAAATGTGKGIALVAGLSRICDYVNKSPVEYKRRPMNVLWFAPERSLASALCAEIGSEPQDFGMVAKKIQTYDAGEGSFKLQNPPPMPGIVFACPQFFWEVKGRERSRETIKQYLSNYDTIIWDECDFASERLKAIVDLAPHALKMGITATPITGQALVKTHLCIGPVIEYVTVRELDKALKLFRYISGGCVDNVQFYPGEKHALRLGLRVEKETGASNSSDSLTAVLGTAIAAVDWADQLERMMREKGIDDWYSPHVIVRVTSVAQGGAIYGHLRDYLKTASARSDLFGKGWDVVINHGRLKTKNPDGSVVPKEDRKLGNPAEHSWFRAKQYLNGQCDDKCKRVLIVCDMGIRGTNNWCCAAAVDATDDLSIVVHSQFSHSGRIGRWPPNRAYWHDRGDLHAYMTPQIYIPKSEASEEKRNALKETARWMFHMADIIDQSGVSRWADLLAGEGEVGTPAIVAPKNPFTEDDALQLEVGLSKEAEHRPLREVTGAEVEQVIARLPPEMTDDRLEGARKHAYEFINDPQVRHRHRMRALEDMQKHGVLAIVEQEIPKEASQFTDEDMARYVQKLNATMDLRTATEEWRATPRGVQTVLRRQNADRLRKIYMQALPKTRKLHTCLIDGVSTVGVLDEMTNEYLGRWRNSRDVLSADVGYGEVKKCVVTATKKLFGLDNIDNDSVLDTSAGHYKLMGNEGRRRLLILTKDELIRRGCIKIAGSQS